MEKITKGIIQYVSPSHQICSRGSVLYKSRDQGNSWVRWCKLPVGIIRHVAGMNRWSSRLARAEVYQVLRIDSDLYACFAFGFVFLIENATGKAEMIGEVAGSRVLSACVADGKIYYGEYIYNEERIPISFYSYNVSNSTWSTLHTFYDIRHIHGVFWDDFESKLWITTGDLDDESAVIRFDDNMDPQKMVHGTQEVRAVDLLFQEMNIFYATDAPDDKNFICRMNRKTGDIEKLQPVGGPVFWGRQVGDCLFFSTVVEPSEVNRMDAAELWSSRDKGKTWNKSLEFEKDKGIGLFQYGQIKFPSGPGDGEHLWFTPYATALDHRVARIPLSTV